MHRLSWALGGLVMIALAGAQQGGQALPGAGRSAAPAPAPTAIDPREVTFRSGAYFPRSKFTLRSEVRLVELPVVVRDGRSQTVAGLQRGGFEVRDEGKRREVVSFAVLTPSGPVPIGTPRAPSVPPSPPAPVPEVRPRFIGIVFDDLNTEFPEFRLSQFAARRFVKTGLSAGDQVGLFSTYGRRLLPFTSDADLLAATIDKLSYRTQKPSGFTCPELSEYESYLIANNRDPDALDIKVKEASGCNPAYGLSGMSTTPNPRAKLVDRMQDPLVRYVVGVARDRWNEVRARTVNTLGAIQAVVDSMASLPGSSTLLLVSGGFLSQTATSEQDSLVTHALRAGVVVNSLDAKGLYTLSLEVPQDGDGTRSLALRYRASSTAMTAGNDAMANLALSTGGRFFRDSNDLRQGFVELGAAPQVTYLLGFRPDPQPDGKYHKLKVGVKEGKDYSIQARPGYFASREELAQPAVERRIDRELFGAGTMADVPAWLTIALDKPTVSAPALVATVHLDIKRLTFEGSSGVRTAKVNFLVALLDEQGNFVTGKDGSVDLAMRDSTFAALSTKGIAANFRLETLAGKYRLRALIEETAPGKLTSIDQLVEIP